MADNLPVPPVATEHAAAPPHSVDCIGIALDLEDRARTVESQTAQRAMLRGAQALRTLYAHPPLAAERAAAQEPPAPEREEGLRRIVETLVKDAPSLRTFFNSRMMMHPDQLAIWDADIAKARAALAAKGAPDD